MIIPIQENKKITDKAESLKKEIEKFTDVEIDYSEKRPGEKFNHWEMKGIPIRIDLGMKDLENKKITIFRRDLDKKEIVNEKDVVKRIKEISEEFTKNLIKKADNIFQDKIKDAKNMKEIKDTIQNGGIARIEFCSMDKEGEKCAEIIEKEVCAEVRGTRLDETQKPKGKCAVCGKKANQIVYIARAY